jgi:hypothetical protein
MNGGAFMQFEVGSNTRRAVEIPLLIALPLLAGYVLALELSRDTLDIVVEDKNIVTNGDPSEPSDKWLVYAPDEVFTVAGDWTRGEFFAGQRFSELKPGNAYRVEVVGWRVPAINWYRKIVRAEHTAT